MAKVDIERRTNRRYDVRLPIHYCACHKGGRTVSGSSTTCEVSTKGLSFRCRNLLPAGAHIEMTITWPLKYGDLFPINLYATGFVLRSEHGRTAVRLTSHKLRVVEMPIQSTSATVGAGNCPRCS